MCVYYIMCICTVHVRILWLAYITLQWLVMLYIFATLECLCRHMMSRSTKIAEATDMIIIYYKYLSPGACIYLSVVNKPFITGFVCMEFGISTLCNIYQNAYSTKFLHYYCYRWNPKKLTLEERKARLAERKAQVMEVLGDDGNETDGSD